MLGKPGKGSFCAIDLELLLRVRGVRNLVLAIWSAPIEFAADA